MVLKPLLVLGIAFGLGALVSVVFKKIKLPQVIGYILIGLVLGLSGLGVFHSGNLAQYSIVSNLALGFIGFGIGGELRWARVKRFGSTILLIAFFEAFLAALVVFGAVFVFTNNLPLSLLIGALAAATAPGGTTQVLQECRARGPLTTILFGVVGADDAIAIMIFAFASAFSFSILGGESAGVLYTILHAGIEILGSIGLGAVMGIALSLIMLKIRDDDLKLLTLFSALFLALGLSQLFGLSMIMSAMVMGIVVGNLRPHRSRGYFLFIQKFSPPIFILFFILVGAQINISLLPKMGFLGILYIGCRCFGKVFGARFGAELSGAPRSVKKYLGFCLFSQAGVAIGLAMSAQLQLIEIGGSSAALGAELVGLIAATTFVFQILGPIMTKYALYKAGEIKG